MPTLYVPSSLSLFFSLFCSLRTLSLLSFFLSLSMYIPLSLSHYLYIYLSISICLYISLSLTRCFYTALHSGRRACHARSPAPETAFAARNRRDADSTARSGRQMCRYGENNSRRGVLVSLLLLHCNSSPSIPPMVEHRRSRSHHEIDKLLSCRLA